MRLQHDGRVLRIRSRAGDRSPDIVGRNRGPLHAAGQRHLVTRYAAECLYAFRGFAFNPEAGNIGRDSEELPLRFGAVDHAVIDEDDRVRAENPRVDEVRAAGEIHHRDRTDDLTIVETTVIAVSTVDEFAADTRLESEWRGIALAATLQDLAHTDRKREVKHALRSIVGQSHTRIEKNRFAVVQEDDAASARFVRAANVGNVHINGVARCFARRDDADHVQHDDFAINIVIVEIDDIPYARLTTNDAEHRLFGFGENQVFPWNVGVCAGFA